jgi:hypothetical protein
MASRLDKNSKLPSGKGKESSSTAKPKAKAAAADTKASKSAKAAPAKPAAESAKPKTAAKAASKESPARKAAPESKSNGSKSPASAKAKNSVPATRRAAAPSESGDGPGLEEFSIALIKSGETRERIWRTKNFQQVPAQREFGFPDTAPELPGQYHQDKLVLMPKDPEYMFCYWELTPGLVEDKSREKVPDGNYRETLKINWESRSLFEPNFTFIPVFFWARKWYFGVPQVGQRYQVELGWLSENGHFISIIRSNLSELPESWAQTQKRLSEQGDVLAYSARNSKILGSSEHLVVEDSRAFVPEWNLSSESFSSSSWSRAAGQGGEQQAAPAKAQSPAAKPASSRKPAVPKARLEISGKVLPGTQVLVGGKAVPTDAMGFFKTEFPYEQDSLSLQLTDRAGSTRSFAYDLKELVLT